MPNGTRFMPDSWKVGWSVGDKRSERIYRRDPETGIVLRASNIRSLTPTLTEFSENFMARGFPTFFVGSQQGLTLVA